MITSNANPRVKLARSLLRVKGRRKHQLWLLEGIKTIEEAFKHNCKVKTLFYTNKLCADTRAEALLAKAERTGVPILEISQKLMQELSDVQTPQGILGMIESPHERRDLFPLEIEEPFLLIFDRIQDPGNLGTVLRTGLAVGINGAIFLPGTVDPGNPKVIRASAGAGLSLPIEFSGKEDLIKNLRSSSIELFATSPAEGKSVFDVNWKGKRALLVGNEGAGVEDHFYPYIDEIVKIPMPGPTESLNVSVATAVCMYEALRQRGVRK